MNDCTNSAKHAEAIKAAASLAARRLKAARKELAAAESEAANVTLQYAEMDNTNHPTPKNNGVPMSKIWGSLNRCARVYLAILGSVVAFLSYYKLIHALPATQVSMITLIFPVVAILLGWVVLGEKLSANAGFGIALIMGGVGLALARRTGSSKAS